MPTKEHVWRCCDGTTFNNEDSANEEEIDPTPWCHYCGTADDCDCGPIAENEQ